MGGEVAELVALLELDRSGADRFESRPVDADHPRLYGGQLVAQALLAAGRSVEAERRVHALHALFLRTGVVTDPVSFRVEAVRDGSTFSTRRVLALQADRLLLSLDASFQVPEIGHEQLDPPPDVPEPDEMVETDDWVLAGEVPDDDVPHYVDAVEFRQLASSLGGPGKAWSSGLEQPVRDEWLRARQPLPDDPLLHACVLAYASDKPMLGTTALSPPLHDDPRPHLLASLDHSMWFHQPFRVDDWMLARLTSSLPGGGRAFATGLVHRHDGALAVRITQEGLARPLTPLG